MKDNFDDILKRKLEQQHYPVDASHRQQMADLLNNEKRRRPFPVWWVSGMLVVATVASLIWLNNDAGSVESTERKSAIESESGTITVPVDMTEAVHDVNEIKEATNQVQTTVERNETITTDINLNESELFSISNNNNPITPESTHLNANAIPSTVANHKSGSASQLKTDLQPESDEILTMALVDNGNVRVEVKAVEGAEEVIFTDAEIYDDDSDIRVAQPADPMEVLAIEKLTLIPASKVDPVTPMTTFKKSFYLFGEAGAGLVFGSQPHYATGWKLRAGAGLGYRLSPKVQASLTAGYLYQNGGFDFQRISAVNQPGFGTRSTFNSLTPDKLHFVYSKIGVQVRARRHIFATHGGMQYLYGAQGEITKQVDDQFAPGTIETTTYSWVKTDGLRSVNWSMDLSYGYQLTPRLSITAGADYYFSSFTIDDPALVAEGFTWSGAYSPVQPFIHINYLLYGRL